jgi:hypothetical protein
LDSFFNDGLKSFVTEQSELPSPISQGVISRRTDGRKFQKIFRGVQVSVNLTLANLTLENSIFQGKTIVFPSATRTSLAGRIESISNYDFTTIPHSRINLSAKGAGGNHQELTGTNYLTNWWTSRVTLPVLRIANASC